MWCASRVIFAWWCVKHNQGQHPCQQFWQHVSCSTSLWCTFGWLLEAAGFFLSVAFLLKPHHQAVRRPSCFLWRGTCQDSSLLTCMVEQNQFKPCALVHWCTTVLQSTSSCSHSTAGGTLQLRPYAACPSSS